MRHYHRLPLAEKGQNIARFLHQRHALLPFSCPEEAPLAFEVRRSVILDHGCAERSQHGAALNPEEYIRWCEEWHRHPGFDWALIPDAGDEADNDALLRAWPKKICGVPIYHLHEDPQRLLRLAEQYPLVALGSNARAWSTPGTSGWWSRMAAILDIICDQDGRPPCKLHGTGMMAPDIFTALPLASVDGSCAMQNQQPTARFGSYRALEPSQRAQVIADRIEAHNSAPVWQRPRKQLMYPGPQKMAL
ncbi:hypothetical protein [Geothermobacter hydrogeniphilus]|uniref:Uncharacterized protein n=1 Tax=Geothermobacter hydrogeniphilus TaxID=1969733 RepID=A0A1X0XW75_9BACT|nr:hypothetical protein [Geothermobacter hydrogeniphilus]ORJ57133.1 hypothetical protein B5V00_14040 [Geothermobacter hydrogeniphilus]